MHTKFLVYINLWGRVKNFFVFQVDLCLPLSETLPQIHDVCVHSQNHSVSMTFFITWLLGGVGVWVSFSPLQFFYQLLPLFKSMERSLSPNEKRLCIKKSAWGESNCPFSPTVPGVNRILRGGIHFLHFSLSWGISVLSSTNKVPL